MIVISNKIYDRLASSKKLYLYQTCKSLLPPRKPVNETRMNWKPRRILISLYETLLGK